jgi:hypothetical protein
MYRGQHTSLVHLKNNPNYGFAKAGDVIASFELIESLYKPNKFNAIKAHPDAEIVAIKAIEKSGVNVIPLALAERLSFDFGNKINSTIFVDNQPNHTGASMLHRIANPCVFIGEVEVGKQYYAVDDVTTSGSTINSLKRYIERHGGIFIGFEVMATSRYGLDIFPTKLDREQLEAQFGGAEKTDQIIKKYLNEYGTEGLSKKEINYLTQNIQDEYTLRERIFKEHQRRAIKEITEVATRRGSNKKTQINQSHAKEKEKNMQKKEDDKIVFDAQNKTTDSDCGPGVLQWETHSGYSVVHREPKEREVFIRRELETNRIQYDFFAEKDRIESSDDVAKIFRALESEAQEHAFLVMVNKNKQFNVLWHSTGGIAATIIDAPMVSTAIKYFKAETCYFIHNHPSGTLRPSKEDGKQLSILQDIAEETGCEMKGIIVNLLSGKAIEFHNEEEYQNLDTSSIQTEHKFKIDVLSFSKQVFLKSPMDMDKIVSNTDAAQFISQLKFSKSDKLGCLVLTNQLAVSAAFMFSNTKNLRRDIDLYTGLYGGRNVILFGSKDVVNELALSDLYRVQNDTKTYRVLDFVELDHSPYILENVDSQLIQENSKNLQFNDVDLSSEKKEKNKEL